jgi:hypothetical protein
MATPMATPVCTTTVTATPAKDLLTTIGGLLSGLGIVGGTAAVTGGDPQSMAISTLIGLITTYVGAKSGNSTGIQQLIAELTGSTAATATPSLADETTAAIKTVNDLVAASGDAQQLLASIATAVKALSVAVPVTPTNIVAPKPLQPTPEVVPVKVGQ